MFFMSKKVTTNFKKPLGRHFIKEWRLFRGLTHEDLAELLGMSVGWISQLENNKIGYTQERLEAIAEVLFCSVADLVARPPTSEWGLDMMIKDSSEADRTAIIEMVKAFVKNRAA